MRISARLARTMMVGMANICDDPRVRTAQARIEVSQATVAKTPFLS